ncbi:MAG TPA: RNA polymerase sigma-70 factor [Bacteroidales bacterium]|nr:RNA polymerase sigma-70 factor [Bacteroidales bacterium]
MIKERFILAALKRGDIKAFENLFHSYYPRLCRYAETLLKTEGLPEEIVQDVFYNIWKKRKELAIKISLKSYLYRSVYNHALMHLRKYKHEIRLDENWAVNQAGEMAGPMEKIDEKEISSLVSATLSTLPERTRVIFTLNRMEGMTYRDIAERLSVSVKTVEANMSKALKALRRSLNEYSSY